MRWDFARPVRPSLTEREDPGREEEPGPVDRAQEFWAAEAKNSAEAAVARPEQWAFAARVLEAGKLRS